MAIYAPKAKPAVQIEPGTYIARCYSMVHIGTVAFDYMGQKKVLNKVRITFEFPTELHEFKQGEGEKPFSLSQEYTLSLHEKSKLRPVLESWRGKKFTDEEIEKFDISKLVGVPAMVSVIQNEKGYSNISSITKLPKATECPPQVNESFILDYEENWSEEKFNKLPEFLRNKISQSDEYQKMKGIATENIPTPDSDPEAIPF